MEKWRMTKKGIEYELFVKKIYECLNREDGLSDIKVQHDVKLTGASGVEHQIDIFWAFDKGGINYKVAIECKDYKGKVSKEKIAAFHDILHDIGNIHGVFVSKNGFQSGAREYASKYGIQIMEIRHPDNADWEGRIKEIQIVLRILTIEHERVHILINEEEIKSMGISVTDKEAILANTARTVIEFDTMTVKGEVISKNGSKTLLELINLLKREDAGKGFKCLFVFTGGFLYCNDKVLPIESLGFIYDVKESIELININGDEIIKAIVKNITEGTEYSIDKFGTVKKRVELQNET